MLNEKIKEYTEKMNVPFAMRNYIKIAQLESEIKRNVKRELAGGNTIQFTSQDLRALIIQIHNTHRKLNNTVNFSKFQKRFEKYDYVSGKELKEETLSICNYMVCAKYLQEVYSLLNYDAVLLFFIELQHQQKKEEDNNYFNEELTKLIRSL